MLSNKFYYFKLIFSSLLFYFLYPDGAYSQYKRIYRFEGPIELLNNDMHNSFPSIEMIGKSEFIIGYRSSSGHLNAKSRAKLLFLKNSRVTKEITLDDGSDFEKTRYGIRSVNITKLTSDTLFASYHVNDGDYGGLYFRTSGDNGVSWSNRKEIIPQDLNIKKLSCEGHIIELGDRYLLPVFQGNKNDSLNSGVLISKNFQKWNYSELPEQTGKEIENIVVDCKNEILMFYSDPNKRKLYRSTSLDKGLTWSTPEDVTFEGWIVHRPSVFYDSKNENLLLLYREGNKQSGAVAVSKDKGQSWEKLQSLNDDGRRITYGDFVKISSKKIGLV